MLIYKDLRRIRSTGWEGVGGEVCVSSCGYLQWLYQQLVKTADRYHAPFFIQIFLTWIYISVVEWNFTWILTCAIFTMICAWSLSKPWKKLFCQWKVKFWRKKFSSTLLYEMIPLCIRTCLTICRDWRKCGFCRIQLLINFSKLKCWMRNWNHFSTIMRENMCIQIQCVTSWCSGRLIGSPRHRSRVQDPISTINIHEGRY
jgi:hypothetical protein